VGASPAALADATKTAVNNKSAAAMKVLSGFAGSNPDEDMVLWRQFMRSKNQGGICPHLIEPSSKWILVLRPAFELFEFALLTQNLLLVLIDLPVLFHGGIVSSLQLIADQSAGAQS
jgi:hypothetical protein